MTLRTASPLAALLGPIQDDLLRVEAEIRRMSASPLAEMKALLDHVGRFSGKRLRPALTLVAGRMFGPLLPEHATVGAIIELIHTATLVHDDILDESALRRNIETVNRRVGNETAVLLGDYLFATCFKEASALEDRFASRYLAEIARAPGEAGEALAEYGLRIGTAFQIVDDILDLTGEEATVGKSLGTDLEKAKMTLPLLRLRERATARDRERLRRALLSGDRRERDAILPLLREYGAIASARATAEALVEEARRDLRRLPEGPERSLLFAAADYVLARDR